MCVTTRRFSMRTGDVQRVSAKTFRTLSSTPTVIPFLTPVISATNAGARRSIAPTKPLATARVHRVLSDQGKTAGSFAVLLLVAFHRSSEILRDSETDQTSPDDQQQQTSTGRRDRTYRSRTFTIRSRRCFSRLGSDPSGWRDESLSTRSGREWHRR